MQVFSLKFSFQIFSLSYFENISQIIGTNFHSSVEFQMAGDFLCPGFHRQHSSYGHSQLCYLPQFWRPRLQMAHSSGTNNAVLAYLCSKVRLCSHQTQPLLVFWQIEQTLSNFCFENTFCGSVLPISQPVTFWDNLSYAESIQLSSQTYAQRHTCNRRSWDFSSNSTQF